MDLTIPDFLNVRKIDPVIRKRDLDFRRQVIRDSVQIAKKEEPKEELKEEEVVLKRPVDIQARVFISGCRLVSWIEDMFEDQIWREQIWTPESKDLYNYLFLTSTSKPVATIARDMCQEHVHELTQIDEDEDLKQAYKQYTKSEIDLFIAFWTHSFEVLNRYIGNVQNMKVRKPRKTRAKSVEKKLAGFKYLPQQNELKLTSVSPTKIIGAVQVVLFNHKYLTLTMLTARNSAGFDIKGQTILNVDEVKSLSKRIGRKTEEILDKIIKGSKKDVKKILDEISSKAIKIQTRPNNQTVILKVN